MVDTASATSQSNGSGAAQNAAANATSASSASARSGSDVAASMVDAATDASGRVDTAALAGQVMDAARTDPAAASAAYSAIESRLSVADKGRLAADTRTLAQQQAAANNNEAGPVGLAQPGVGPTVTGAAQGAIDAGQRAMTQGAGLTARGTQALVDNPILSVRWEGTTSAWNNQGGFSGPLADRLRAGGIEVASAINPPPPGSVGPASGLSVGVANNVNGPLAEQAIANRYAAQGFTVTTAPNPANQVQDGARVVDVVATRPGADPRMALRVETESKVGYTSDTGRAAREATMDIDRLADNRAAREAGLALEASGVNLSRAGQVLDAAGRVARPVGVVLDVVEVGSAFHADGNRIGDQTGAALSGLAGGAAGGYGGALAGAAIGTAIFPGVGTVVGGIIGGIAGGLAGDAAGRGLFGTIRGWF